MKCPPFSLKSPSPNGVTVYHRSGQFGGELGKFAGFGFKRGVLIARTQGKRGELTKIVRNCGWLASHCLASVTGLAPTGGGALVTVTGTVVGCLLGVQWGAPLAGCGGLVKGDDKGRGSLLPSAACTGELPAR